MNGKRPLRGARILVVDDEPLLAFDMARVLKEAGAAVVGPAMCLERALELVREPLSCGILDVRLRDRLVFPAAEELSQKGAGIVFYTGHPDPEGLKKEWPHAQVLFKPAPLKLLISAVQAACGSGYFEPPFLSPESKTLA